MELTECNTDSGQTVVAGIAWMCLSRQYAQRALACQKLPRLLGSAYTPAAPCEMQPPHVIVLLERSCASEAMQSSTYKLQPLTGSAYKLAVLCATQPSWLLTLQGEPLHPSYSCATAFLPKSKS